MTQPATTTTAPNPPPGDAADDVITTALVAAILAHWAHHKIRDLLKKLHRIHPDTIDWMLNHTLFAKLLTMDNHTPTDPILAAARHRNIQRRAAYAVAATRRMDTALDTHHLPTIRAAWTQELDHMGAHLAANHARNAAWNTDARVEDLADARMMFDGVIN